MRRVYKNLCPATISASIMATNMWKNSSKNVESDNNKILYETLLDFFLQRNGTYFLNKPCTSTKTQCNILEDESSVCLHFIFVCCWVWDIFAPANSTALGINAVTLTTSLTIYAVLWGHKHLHFFWHIKFCLYQIIFCCDMSIEHTTQVSFLILDHLVACRCNSNIGVVSV